MRRSSAPLYLALALALGLPLAVTTTAGAVSVSAAHRGWGRPAPAYAPYFETWTKDQLPAVARASGGGTAFGAVLDSTCDRIADAAVFGTIAWYYAMHGQRWMLLSALLCLVLGSLTSYIRARAEAAGLTMRLNGGNGSCCHTYARLNANLPLQNLAQIKEVRR